MKFLPALFVLLLVGCAPFKPATAPAQKAASAMSAEQSDYVSVGADLATAMPMVSVAAKNLLADAQARLADAKKQNQAATDALAKLEQHDEAMTAGYNQLEDDWLGGRGHRWAWGIGIAIAIAGVLGIVCMVVANLGTGVVGGSVFVGGLIALGHFFLSWVPVVGHWIGALLHEVFRRRSVTNAVAKATAAGPYDPQTGLNAAGAPSPLAGSPVPTK